MLTLNLLRNYEPGLPVFEHYPKLFCRAVSLNVSLSEQERGNGSTKACSIYSRIIFACQTVKDPGKRQDTANIFQLCPKGTHSLRLASQSCGQVPHQEPSNWYNSQPSVGGMHTLLQRMCSQSNWWCTDGIPEVKMHAVIRLLTCFLQGGFGCICVITGQDSHERQMNDYSSYSCHRHFFCVSSLCETCLQGAVG